MTGNQSEVSKARVLSVEVSSHFQPPPRHFFR